MIFLNGMENSNLQNAWKGILEPSRRSLYIHIFIEYRKAFNKISLNFRKFSSPVHHSLSKHFVLGWVGILAPN